MKQKIFTLFLTLVVSVGLVSAEIIERVSIGDLYYNLDTEAKTAEVTYMNRTESMMTPYNEGWMIVSAVIPDSVKYQNVAYSVTSIGECAFCGCSVLSFVVIGNNVTDIRAQAFAGCVNLSSVIMGSKVTSIGEFAFIYCRNLHALPVANNLKEIGWYAFAYCNLENVVLPASVEVVGECAFVGNYIFDFTNIQGVFPTEPLYDNNEEIQFTIQNITCYGNNPPRVVGYENTAASPFCVFGDNFPYSSISMYVPASSVEIYEGNEYWGNFDVRAIEANQIETTVICVISTGSSADIVWSSVANAATYELVINDKMGTVVCTLIFNANGQLISIAFNAPAREKSTETAGFSFTVTGLEEGRAYDLTITAKDENDNVLDVKSMSFVAGAGEQQGFESVYTTGKKTTKFIKDGQIYILRGEKVYTLQGQEVK